MRSSANHNSTARTGNIGSCDNVVWAPQPRQTAFLRRAEYEALYGGAAGGGKSEALVIEALRQVGRPYYKGLILRKTYPQLAELIDKSRHYYPRIVPRAKYNGGSHVWTFPSGAKVIFGSMQYAADTERYRGQAYDFVGFDELTHFSWPEYVFMFSRNRPNGPNTRVYIRSTANPGGVGHGWVKARFVTAAPPMTTIWEPVSWRDQQGNTHTTMQSRIFVPSSVFDNTELMRNDPLYVARLAAMPDADRRALLYGDWDSFSGQVFAEWRNLPDHYADRLHTHVISPFAVPADWRIWRSFDWGFARPFSCHWYAIDRDRRMYCIRELYGSTGDPNVGAKWEPAGIAAKIKEIEADDPNLRGRNISGVADPAIFNSSGAGESIAALMEAGRVYWEPGDHNRINGKMQVHHRLAFAPDGRPMLYVFSTCPHMIRTLPALVYANTNVEDVDTAGEDHAYDELRYICMRNPIAPRAESKAVLPPYDPLDLHATTPQYDPYAFYRRY